MSYATVMKADVPVGAVAGLEPPFLGEHLYVVAEVNQAYAGRRQFTAATGVAADGAMNPTVAGCLIR